MSYTDSIDVLHRVRWRPTQRPLTSYTESIGVKHRVRTRPRHRDHWHLTQSLPMSYSETIDVLYRVRRRPTEITDVLHRDRRRPTVTTDVLHRSYRDHWRSTQSPLTSYRDHWRQTHSPLTSYPRWDKRRVEESFRGTMTCPLSYLGFACYHIHSHILPIPFSRYWAWNEKSLCHFPSESADVKQTPDRLSPGLYFWTCPW